MSYKNDEKDATWFDALRQKRSTPVGRLAFVGLRGADTVFQHKVLTIWGTRFLNQIGYPIQSTIAQARTGYHGLTPIQTMFLAFSAGAALKQSIWVGMVDQSFPVAPAVAVSVYNTVLNSINGIVMLYTTQNQPELGPFQYAGAALFGLGIFLEFGSEVQRTAFKKDSANAGRVYTGGLFSLSRHINYFGYTVWRTGFALASGSWILAALSASWFTFDFVARGIPVLDEYCSKRYNAQWDTYKRQTPAKFVPFLW